MKIRNSNNRSGITLLFTISMIVLFLLMGASFVIMSSQFRRSSVDRGRLDTRRDDARALVSRAFYDLMRGPSLNNTLSPLRGHSILADQYGFGIRAFVSAAGSVTGTDNQFIVVQLDSAPMAPITGLSPTPGLANDQYYAINSVDGDPTNPVNHFDFSDVGGAYDGQVLTFTSGPANGVSTRIISYQVLLDGMGNITGRQFVLMPEWDDTDTAFSVADIGNLQDSQVIINGRDFAGVGAGGLDPVDPIKALDEAVLSAEALQPNQLGVARAALLALYLQTTPNEGYDAVDYQNMFMASIPDADGDGAIEAANIIPSFHRDALVDYHVANATATEPEYSFRVTQTNGGNADFATAAAGAAPEVDNDGDGIADGVWIDIGLPIQTDMRGRVYKPLVSYLVVDMDGKINVNAHGSIADLDADENFVPTRTDLLGGLFKGNRGQGYGPPEVNMGSLFGFGSTNFDGLATPTDSQYLMFGGSTGARLPIDVPGRYGADDVPGAAGFDASLINKWNGYPQDSVGGYFGSPMDPMGRYGVGAPDFFRTAIQVDPYDPNAAPATLDIPIGLPVVDVYVSSWGTTAGLGGGTELVNSPYEMSFRQKSFMPTQAVDTPFSPREMERVMRMYDHDTVMLPPRLREFTRNTMETVGESTRFAFTTDSWEVPTPPTNLVDRLRNTLITFNGLPTDANGNLTAADIIQVNVQIQTMLAPEIVKGLKMNPNRWFGNSEDSNGDDIVDNFWHSNDPAINEGLSNETFVQDNGTGSPPAIGFDHDNDGVTTGDADAHLASQYFARNLYVMTLLVTQYVDRDGDADVDLADWYDYNMDGTTTIDDIYDYRIDVAQWAINVANFRDRDSICHPFEFDLNPWDGWDVNHILDDNTLDPTTTLTGTAAEDPALTRVVWGVERPEMVFSEVAAMHDRRTEDRDDDDGRGEFSLLNGGTDTSFDSKLVPNASVFFEFYHPWINHTDATINDNNLTYPPEFGTGGINLQARTGDGSPVWQVMVTDSTSVGISPDDTPIASTLMEDQVVRRVYFVQPTIPQNAGNADTYYSDKVYFPDPALRLNMNLLPGQYAVVGSAGVQDGDNHNTYLGRRNTITWNDPAELADTRRITLNPVTNSMEIRWFDGAAFQTSTRPGLVLPINQQYESATSTARTRSLGITDPEQGYDRLTGSGLLPVADGFEFATVRDQPADEVNPSGGGANPLWPLLSVDGLHENDTLVRYAHLRRLANPTAPHDPVLNPYLTIDTINIPVNVFNGASSTDELVAGNRTMPYNNGFGSRERSANDRSRGRDRVLWTAPHLPLAAVRAGTETPTDSHYHSFNLFNSLMEIDEDYRNDGAGGASASINVFPWLNWNNRPFVSHLEMTMVPYSSNFEMLRRFDYETGWNPGDDYFTQGPAAADPYRDSVSGRFRHLFGFHADGDDPVTAVTTEYEAAPHLSKVLDYLEVPSRFTGTETYFNPAIFGAAGNIFGFNPPFNTFSNYRYPGKINLNTIYDARVWNGLMRNYNLEVDFATFTAVREGNNAATPTEITRPFRPAESSNMVPAGPGLGDLLGSSSEAGLFRRGLAGADPLFDVDTNPGPHSDPTRNAYFRYEMRNRLGNLVTNRSSVFAIWITVGFFEVDENLQVGREVGSDTGDVQRYRGFYMIDRSIPVAVEPGFNHNVDQAILTSSIIEAPGKLD